MTQKQKLDLRVIKTRKAIKDAFLTLLQSKGYERITVQDIADEALINRNTFYLHYQDKPDLMSELSKECLHALDASLQTDKQEIEHFNQDDFTLIVEKMLITISQDLDFYQVMLSEHGQSGFAASLKEVLKQHILGGMSPSRHDDESTRNPMKVEVGLEYVVSGIVGVISLWISQSDQFPIADTAKELSEVHFRNMQAFL